LAPELFSWRRRCRSLGKSYLSEMNKCNESAASIIVKIVVVLFPLQNHAKNIFYANYNLVTASVLLDVM